MADPTQRHGRATETAESAIVSAAGYVVLAKMRWRTPPDVVAKVAAEMRIDGFDLDACAGPENHVAPRYYTAEDDCLTQNWSKGGWHAAPNPPAAPVRNVWLNPPWGSKGVSEAALKAGHALGLDGVAPFPGTEAFVRYAWEQSRAGLTVACLLPQALDTVWQRSLALLADEIWLGGRVSFLDHEGKEGDSPPGGHLLMIFRPHVPVSGFPQRGWPGGPKVRWNAPW